MYSPIRSTWSNSSNYAETAFRLPCLGRYALSRLHKVSADMKQAKMILYLIRSGAKAWMTACSLIGLDMYGVIKGLDRKVLHTEISVILSQ